MKPRSSILLTACYGAGLATGLLHFGGPVGVSAVSMALIVTRQPAALLGAGAVLIGRMHAELALAADLRRCGAGWSAGTLRLRIRVLEPVPAAAGSRRFEPSPPAEERSHRDGPEARRLRPATRRTSRGAGSRVPGAAAGRKGHWRSRSSAAFARHPASPTGSATCSAGPATRLVRQPRGNGERARARRAGRHRARAAGSLRAERAGPPALHLGIPRRADHRVGLPPGSAPPAPPEPGAGGRRRRGRRVRRVSRLARPGGTGGGARAARRPLPHRPAPGRARRAARRHLSAVSCCSIRGRSSISAAGFPPPRSGAHRDSPDGPTARSAQLLVAHAGLVGGRDARHGADHRRSRSGRWRRSASLSTSSPFQSPRWPCPGCSPACCCTRSGAPPPRRLAAGAGLCLHVLELLAVAGAAVPGGHSADRARPGAPRSRGSSRWPWLSGPPAPATRAMVAGRRAGWAVTLGSGPGSRRPCPGRVTVATTSRYIFSTSGRAMAPCSGRRGAAGSSSMPGPRVGAARCGAQGGGAVPGAAGCAVRRGSGHLPRPRSTTSAACRACSTGFPAGVVLEPGAPVADPLYTGFLDRPGRRQIAWHPAHTGERFTLDGVRVHGTPPASRAGRGWGEDVNEDSLVLLVEYGDFQALFAGDAGFPAEAVMRGRLRPGGPAQGGPPWEPRQHRRCLARRRFAPRLAVISRGPERLWPPGARPRSRGWPAHGVPVRRTDQRGHGHGRRPTAGG